MWPQQWCKKQILIVMVNGAICWWTLWVFIRPPSKSHRHNQTMAMRVFSPPDFRFQATLALALCIPFCHSRFSNILLLISMERKIVKISPTPGVFWTKSESPSSRKFWCLNNPNRTKHPGGVANGNFYKEHMLWILQVIKDFTEKQIIIPKP